MSDVSYKAWSKEEHALLDACVATGKSRIEVIEIISEKTGRSKHAVGYQYSVKYGKRQKNPAKGRNKVLPVKRIPKVTLHYDGSATQAEILAYNSGVIVARADGALIIVEL